MTAIKKRLIRFLHIDRIKEEECNLNDWYNCGKEKNNGSRRETDKHKEEKKK